VVDIPVHIRSEPGEPDQALPYVDVEVGGRTIRALLDSGAARSTLTPPDDASTEARLPEGTGVFGVVTGDRHVWLTAVRLGDRDLGPTEVNTHPAGYGRDLIGQDVLSQYRCEYRFADRQLRLDGPAPRVTAPIVITEGRHVYLDVSWPGVGVTASAVFDTGASVTVVDAAFVDTNPTLFTPDGTSQGVDGSGAAMDTPMVVMSGPQILGGSFASSPAAVVDLSAANRTVARRMDLILGWPILHQANWMIDHAEQQAALTN
jgi:hypothetical protein